MYLSGGIRVQADSSFACSQKLSQLRDIICVSGIGFVVDVRSFPSSRSSPAFNVETQPESLGARIVSATATCQLPAGGGTCSRTCRRR